MPSCVFQSASLVLPRLHNTSFWPAIGRWNLTRCDESHVWSAAAFNASVSLSRSSSSWCAVYLGDQVLEANDLTASPQTRASRQIHHPIIASVAVAILTEAAHLEAGALGQGRREVVRVEVLAGREVLQANHVVVRDRLAAYAAHDCLVRRRGRALRIVEERGARSATYPWMQSGWPEPALMIQRLFTSLPAYERERLSQFSCTMGHHVMEIERLIPSG